MKRAPIVIAGTVIGLLGVLKFHTSPVSLANPAGATVPSSSGGGASPAASAPPTSGGSAAGSGSKQSGGQRTAVGPVVNYSYGTLSVRVTVSGSKIVKIGLASLNDGGSPRSQFIDQQSIPMLEQETLQAQNANIQGVSGASFTSAGFEQSLQGALRSLGIA